MNIFKIETLELFHYAYDSYEIISRYESKDFNSIFYTGTEIQIKIKLYFGLFKF